MLKAKFIYFKNTKRFPKKPDTQCHMPDEWNVLTKQYFCG